jgi:hypothetical protein
MARTFPLVLTLITTGLVSGRSSADHATVTQGAISSAAQGQISANGTYTVKAGYSLLHIKLYVVPEAGGEKGEASCTTDGKKLTWTGDPIDGLISGTTYKVWAEITVYPNGNMTETYTYTGKQMQQKVQ